ncbi:MAG TPA: hypothetical protein VNO43_08570 [Candidatus Eisenbacteria bacterium]|nr:hypothetical protein [Candidatus Eisenbacteria bacterium]
MNRAGNEIEVDCYAGYRADETPRRFSVGPRLVAIVSIIDRGVTPDYRYFKVRGDDGSVYRLVQSLDTRKWKLE